MKNKIILFIAILGTVIGSLLKITNSKDFGDPLIGISTLFWFYFLITSIINYRNKKKELSSAQQSL